LTVESTITGKEHGRASVAVVVKHAFDGYLFAVRK